MYINSFGYNYMYKIVALSLMLALTANSQDSWVVSRLDLSGTGGFEDVRLPFPVLPENIEQTLPQSKVFIAQGIWSYTAPNKVLLTGHLSPCVALIARYTIPGQLPQTLVAHLDYLADITSLFDPIRRLAVNLTFNASCLSIELFTTKHAGYAAPMEHYATQSWQALHGNKTQINHLKSLKDSLCKYFDLERTKVRARIFDSFSDRQSYGHYNGIGSQLAITWDGSVYMVSHYRTDPFFIKQGRELEANNFIMDELKKVKPAAQMATHLRLSKEQRSLPIASFHTLYGKIPMISLSSFAQKTEEMQNSRR